MYMGYLYAQYQVNYLSSTPSTVTVRSIGYAKKAKTAINTAELSAIRTILFQGLDNAIQSSPILSITEEEAIKKYPDYFKTFYEDGYKSFIQSSIIVQDLQKDRAKKKNMVLDITIKLKALRMDLEKNGIIRKFGL